MCVLEGGGPECKFIVFVFSMISFTLLRRLNRIYSPPALSKTIFDSYVRPFCSFQELFHSEYSREVFKSRKIHGTKEARYLGASYLTNFKRLGFP